MQSGGRYVSTKYKSWRINHDAAGKVVVRSVADGGKETVIAVAKWKSAGAGGFTIDRNQSSSGVPNENDWSMIDTEIYNALEAAAGMGPDPRLDKGKLPAKAPRFRDGVELTGKDLAAAKKEDTEPLGLYGWIVTTIFLGGLVVGLYFAWPYIKVALDLVEPDRSANGEACKYNRDCRSGVCDFGQCKATKRSRGDRCDFDSQCSGGDCRKGLCD